MYVTAKLSVAKRKINLTRLFKGFGLDIKELPTSFNKSVKAVNLDSTTHKETLNKFAKRTNVKIGYRQQLFAVRTGNNTDHLYILTFVPAGFRQRIYIIARTKAEDNLNKQTDVYIKSTHGTDIEAIADFVSNVAKGQLEDYRIPHPYYAGNDYIGIFPKTEETE